VLCISKSDFMSQAILRTRRWKGAFLIKRSVFFWYLRISQRATVPGRQRWGFFMPPMCLPCFCAAFVARWMHGAFPPVDWRAVCFVLAIVQLLMLLYLCSCVCVFCGSMLHSRKKRRKRYDTKFEKWQFEPSVHWYYSTYGNQYINARNYWRFPPILQPLSFCSLSQKIHRISIFAASHKTCCWLCVTLYCKLHHTAMFLHNHIPHPPNTQQNQHNQSTIHNHG
jgi:hypothetical protein